MVYNLTRVNVWKLITFYEYIDSNFLPQFLPRQTLAERNYHSLKGSLKIVFRINK